MNKKAIFVALLIGLLVVAIAIVVAKPNKPGKPIKAECMDKVDNDGDGLVDLLDTGCSYNKDNDESNCGDAICEGGEDCNTCPSDCGECPPYCGDGVCDNCEHCNDCVADCGVCPPYCGDKICDIDEQSWCSRDCGAPNGTWVGCGDNYCATNETCESCAQDCGICQCCGDGRCHLSEVEWCEVDCNYLNQ